MCLFWLTFLLISLFGFPSISCTKCKPWCIFAASGSLWPGHQESPDPGPADPELGHEGSDWCLYPGEWLGGGLLRGPPSVHHTPILNTKPGQHKTIENRSPLAWICTLHKREKPQYGLPNGSHVSGSASSSPHFIFAVKLPAPNFWGSAFKACCSL